MLKGKVTGQIWPEFEIIRDLMSVLIICKFEEIQARMNTLSQSQHFLRYRSIGKNSSAHGQITP